MPKKNTKQRAAPKKGKKTNTSAKNKQTSKLVKAPQAVGFTFRGTRKDVSHREGPVVEYLATFNLQKTDTAGTLIGLVNLSPALLSGTRLQRLSSIYAQYKFRKLWVEVTSAAPSVASGQIAVALDRNVGAPPMPAMQYVMACEKNQTGPIWSKFRLEADCNPKLSRQNMYTTALNDDIAEAVQFRLLVVAIQPLAVIGSDSTASIALTVRIGYTCDFSGSISYKQSSPATINDPIENGDISISNLGVVAYTGSGSTSGGWVYAVNPAITEGLEAGSSPIVAVLQQTTQAGVMFGFDSISAALSNGNANAGNVRGAKDKVKLSSASKLIPVCTIPTTKDTTESISDIATSVSNLPSAQISQLITALQAITVAPPLPPQAPDDFVVTGN